jgi:hypothetical protein
MINYHQWIHEGLVMMHKTLIKWKNSLNSGIANHQEDNLQFDGVDSVARRGYRSHRRSR